MSTTKPPLGILCRKLYEEFLADAISLYGGVSPVVLRRCRMKALHKAAERGKKHGGVQSAWICEYMDLLHRETNNIF